MDPNQLKGGGPVAGTAADEALFSKITWRLYLMAAIILALVLRPAAQAQPSVT